MSALFFASFGGRAQPSTARVVTEFYFYVVKFFTTSSKSTETLASDETSLCVNR